MAFERYKKMSISEDFRNGVFKLATGNVSNYWPIFGLDYTPVSQKIEDKAIGCGAQIFSCRYWYFHILVNCIFCYALMLIRTQYNGRKKMEGH
jgi:hypothetical protein